MKKTICSIALMLCYFVSFSQETTQKVQLNFSNLSQKLLQSKTEKTLGVGQLTNSETIISLPLTNGRSANFKMVEYFIVPENAKTDIKTYYGEKEGDPSVTCRVTLTKEKVMASIIENGQTIIVERVPGALLSDEYQVYEQKHSPQQCGNEIEEQIKNGRVGEAKGILNYSYGGTLKTYKLALIVTNEFYNDFVNDAGVNAEIVAIVNNINALYEKELAVRMTLVSPNNPVSSNFFYRKTEVTTSYYQVLGTVQTEINTRFGSANYDLGHCLHNSGGGVASLSSVCSSTRKGRGWSGSTDASGILLFAHELGHQFNANHTFNGNGSGNCGPGNRSNGAAYEPGSGNTIMSYANLCSPSAYNISGGQVPYFHTKSLEEMSGYITTGTGANCAVSSGTSNTPPVANAGLDFTIPKNTPFALTGSGTDADGDALSFTWEQFNLAAVSDTGKLGHKANALGGNAVNSTTAPLFRTLQSTSPIRNFPALQYVLNNSNNPTDNVGEDLTNVGRILTFRLTARDNRSGGGGVHCDDAVVTVDSNGPFEVTTGNGPTLWFQGESKTINWNVNNTASAPINCANVRILTSTDGGNNFTELIASTPNDGSHSFTVPNTPTSQFRIRIEAVGNIFYDINNTNITISSGTCTPEVSTILNASNLSVLMGDPSLNLNLKSRGTQITSYSSAIDGSSPSSNLVFKNSSGVCASPYSNAPSHNLLTFISENTGNTVFTIAAGGSLSGKNLNLYDNLYNSLSQCSNWLNSSAIESSPGGAINLSGSFNQNLQSGNTYQLRISGFSTGNVGSFTVNFSGNSIFRPVPAPGSSYDFTYLIYNTASNLIVGFDPLTNLVSYPEGNYRVYGLSFAGGLNLNSYVNSSFTAFQTALGNGTVCGQLSTNFKNVTILSTNPCQSTLILTNPTDNISSGNVTKTAASGVGGKIIATNLVTGNGTRATYTARAIELNEGFLAEQGTVFKAEVGGCN
jgi:hypothetical protein